MSSLSQMVAVSLLAAPFGYFGVGSLFGDKPFLEVHSMAVDAGVVQVDRSYNLNEPTVADWRVTIVSAERNDPSCQTVPGPGLNQGWSIYEGLTRAERNFHVDVWAGDPGCFERLEPGAYQMFVTWTPRDGTQPVTAFSEFSVN